MKRMFVETDEFRSRWQKLGMTQEDLRELQNHLLEHPDAGPIISGAGGVRKLRWARKGRGKSGGVRVAYADFGSRETTWLVTVFGKNEKADLSPEERKAIKAFVKSLQGESQ